MSGYGVKCSSAVWGAVLLRAAKLASTHRSMSRSVNIFEEASATDILQYKVSPRATFLKDRKI